MIKPKTRKLTKEMLKSRNRTILPGYSYKDLIFPNVEVQVLTATKRGDDLELTVRKYDRKTKKEVDTPVVVVVPKRGVRYWIKIGPTKGVTTND